MTRSADDPILAEFAKTASLRRCRACRKYWVRVGDPNCINCGIIYPAGEPDELTRSPFVRFIEQPGNPVLLILILSMVLLVSVLSYPVVGMGGAVITSIMTSYLIYVLAPKGSRDAAALASSTRGVQLDQRSTECLMAKKSRFTVHLDAINRKGVRAVEAKRLLSTEIAPGEAQQHVTRLREAIGKAFHYRKLFTVKLDEIEMLRWQNSLAPFVTHRDVRMTHAKAERAHQEIITIHEEGKDIRRLWLYDPEKVMDTPDGIALLAKMDALIEACGDLRATMVKTIATLAASAAGGLEEEQQALELDSDLLTDETYGLLSHLELEEFLSNVEDLEAGFAASEDL